MTRQEITQFYQEHHRRLYNISLRILRDSDEAEEVMQDTILKFVTGGNEGSFVSDAQVSAWLARTCIRSSIDRLRRRQRRDAFLKDYAADALPEDTIIPDDHSVIPSHYSVIPSEVEESLTVERIRSAMDILAEPYRLVLNLVLIEGLDYGEIAGLTGRKETTLRSLYSRGRAKLIEMLKQI